MVQRTIAEVIVDSVGTGDDDAVIAALETVITGGIADKAEVAALTPVATANATDLATAQALANANKVAINAIIAALKA